FPYTTLFRSLPRAGRPCRWSSSRRGRWGWSLRCCRLSGHAPEHPCLQAFLDGIEFRRICRFRSEEVPTLRWYVTLPQLASTDSSSGLPSGGDQSPAHCRMDSDGWLDPGAASGGLRGALPLGAPVDGIRRLRMRGARRESRQMRADGLGGSLHWGPAANFTCPSGWLGTICRLKLG